MGFVACLRGGVWFIVGEVRRCAVCMFVVVWFSTFDGGWREGELMLGEGVGGMAVELELEGVYEELVEEVSGGAGGSKNVRV